MMRLVKALSSTLIIILALSSCVLIKRTNDSNDTEKGGSNPTIVIATPVVTPGTGVVGANTEVTITCETVGVSIYYNTGDGSQADPNQVTGTLYDPQNKPVLTPPIILKAKAFMSDASSDAVTIAYRFTKIIAGGSFTNYNNISRNHIAGLDTNGTLDTSFDPVDGTNDIIYSMVLQSDGKILIGGAFTSYNGTALGGIARLNIDGSLDTFFDPGSGTNGHVYSIALQGDGKILIGGEFSSYNGTGRNRIARLNTDGSLDTSFDPGGGASRFVEVIALQSDGKILIGGGFNYYNGTLRNRIARLNADGSLDTSLAPGYGPNYPVDSIAIQSDGKILISGEFSSYNHITRYCVARINGDGSLDTSFNSASGADENIYAMLLQSDGKILIGGAFTSYKGITRNGIARLNSDASLDTSFDPGSGANSDINSMALQSDGKILVGGAFTSYNGTTQNHIARIDSDGSLNNSYTGGFDSAVLAILLY